MKKAVLTSILVLVALVVLVIPANTTVAPPEMAFDVMMYREEFAYDLDETMIPAQGASAEIPFWVDMVDADLVANDGEGVYIAVLDTGLLDYGNIWQWFFYGANIADTLGKGFSHDIYWDPVEGLVIGPLDDTRGFLTKDYEGSGHGTHVVSTIVGYNYNNIYWVRGVAPKATIIPVLVLDAWEVSSPYGLLQFKGGTDEMVSAGIMYAADLADTLDGPLIISMSLGGDEPSAMIESAINYAIGKGVIIVASAGNEGYAGMGWPGAYPQVISCALAGWTEQWVGYPDRWWLYDVTEKFNTIDYWGNNWQLFLDYLSSRPNITLGQQAWHLDVSTPGAAILGPYKPYFSYNIGYYYVWGTSMSAPHVSGIAALVLQDYPYLAQSRMEHILKIAAAGLPLPSDGALVYDVPGWPYYFTWYGPDWGSGFLQADMALQSARNLARGSRGPHGTIIP